MGRPAPRFHNFVGHKKRVNYLRHLQQGALQKGLPFPHSLFTGPSGVGKTLLASSLAAEGGSQVCLAMGYDPLERLTKNLASLQAGDFFIIDEGHNLPLLLQETLYQAIDNHCIPNPDPLKAKAQPNVQLPPWTLVIATDQPGKLTNALEKRFAVTCHLEPYPIRELKEIAEQVASNENLLLTRQAARRIAEVSVGLPRRVKHYLGNLKLYFPDSEKRALTLHDVEELLQSEGRDKDGLSLQEQRYLHALADRSRVSLGSLAIAVGTDTAYVQRYIEPGIMSRGLAEIAAGGRRLTAQGRTWVTASISQDPNAEESSESDPELHLLEPINEGENDDIDLSGAAADQSAEAVLSI